MTSLLVSLSKRIQPENITAKALKNMVIEKAKDYPKPLYEKKNLSCSVGS